MGENGRKRAVGLRRHQRSSPGRDPSRELGRHEAGPCAGCVEVGGVSRIVEEDEVRGTGPVERRDAGHAALKIDAFPRLGAGGGDDIGQRHGRRQPKEDRIGHFTPEVAPGVARRAGQKDVPPEKRKYWVRSYRFLVIG